MEKGIDPQTSIEDGVNIEEDRLATTTSGQNQPPSNDDCDTVSDDYSDGDEEIDVESSGKIFFDHLFLHLVQTLKFVDLDSYFSSMDQT